MFTQLWVHTTPLTTDIFMCHQLWICSQAVLLKFEQSHSFAMCTFGQNVSWEIYRYGSRRLDLKMGIGIVVFELLKL